MPLPILKTSSTPTTEALVRYFHQTQSNWSAHVAENEPLDVGTAWSNPQLDQVQIANRMMDAALPAGVAPEQAMQIVDDYFAGKNARCLEWVMNPSAPADQKTPMVEFLASRGWQTLSTQIMYLERIPSMLPGNPSTAELQIIPARASFRHARQLHEQLLTGSSKEQRLEARMLHLDDPHYDALLVLRAGQAIGTVGVLAMGETGLIASLAVAESSRKQGIGTLLMGRALEICARSLFKHVMLDVPADNSAAIHLYESFGFRSIGQFVVYQRPASP